jgi:signal transduction histidine kinase
MTVATDPSAQTDSPSEIASVVHDLRSPLAAIHASAEMLVRSALSQPQVNRIARNLYSASVHMRELLEEALERSVGSESKIRLCDVRELVTSAVERVAVSAEFQAVRIVHAAPEGLVVAWDRHRIHRVLVNLLVNALEAMPDGGTIRVTAVSDHHSVVIHVGDSGPGIAPEIRGRLFQPFATAGKAGGIGLGLACSRQAVIDHGGEMWVEPSHQGACFAFSLPRMIPPHAASSRYGSASELTD